MHLVATVSITCDSSGGCVKPVDTSKPLCEYSNCTNSGWDTSDCERGSLCLNGEDNDGDGAIDECDPSCNRQEICYAKLKQRVYFMLGFAEDYPGECDKKCKSLGYPHGWYEKACNSYLCTCQEIIDCCSDADCPSGTQCINHACVMPQEKTCGSKDKPCCPSPNDCVDYEGNIVKNGKCGYPTQDSKNSGTLWYCDNEAWIQTICTCLSDTARSCESLLFNGGSCGSCKNMACADPPGEYKGQEFCCGDIYDSPQGSSQQCESGLHCCGDNKCHECCSDSDCSGYDPDTHTKMVCKCPSGCSLTGSSYSCKALPSCSDNSQCDPNYCCDTITPTYKCKSEGTIINYGGKSYLCDPPYGFATGESEINNPIKEQKVEVTNLIDMIFEIFSKILS